MYSAFSSSPSRDEARLNWALALKSVELSTRSQKHIQGLLIHFEYVLDVQILFTFILQIKRHTLPASLYTVRAGEFTVQFTMGFYLFLFLASPSSTALQACAVSIILKGRFITM